MEELHMGITERIYKKIEKHAVKICFVLAVLLASLITTGVYYRAEAAAQGELQEHLAQEVLRFHVLANSDSDDDQELKLEVRDAKGAKGISLRDYREKLLDGEIPTPIFAHRTNN